MAVFFCRKTAYCELYEGVFLTRVGEPFSTPKETMRLPALRTVKPRRLEASPLRVHFHDYSTSIE